MAVNGSDFINDPFNTTYSPWTDLFADITGFGQLFWLMPLVALTIGVYVKTEDATTTSMFMLVSGALLGSGHIFLGSADIALAFYAFATMGAVGAIISVFTNKGD